MPHNATPPESDPPPPSLMSTRTVLRRAVLRAALWSVLDVGAAGCVVFNCRFRYWALTGTCN